MLWNLLLLFLEIIKQKNAFVNYIKVRVKKGTFLRNISSVLCTYCKICITPVNLCNSGKLSLTD